MEQITPPFLASPAPLNVARLAHLATCPRQPAPDAVQTEVAGYFRQHGPA